MDHIAILSTKLPWLQRILSGEKTIESRWYQSRRTPWQQITIGDTVYFKNSGELITARAMVKSVNFYRLGEDATSAQLLDRHSKELGLLPAERSAFAQQVVSANYAIFISLTQVMQITPFAIDKKGFGAMSAWITVPDITKIVI